jgi:epoxide hydrolase-like predicted phosphatase
MNSKNTIKTIIWDFGGVLVRTEDRRHRTILADRFGLTYAQLENLVFNSESGRAYQLGEITSEQHWENTRQSLNVKSEELPAVQEAFFGGDVLDRELITFIQGLRPSFITAILSNMGDDLRPILTNNLKIADSFDQIIISAELGMMKPDPKIFRFALKRLGVQPPEAIFIDDFTHNIQGAQAIGMNSILFHSRAQVISEIQQLIDNIS